MAVYAIGDLHLSESVPKPMDIFGGAWTGYREKILNGLRRINLTDDDILIIAGDLSWGINLDESLMDFRFIDNFAGKKLLIKGNHDLWWETISKMKRFFSENNIKTLDFIHNNCYIYNDTAICGTRGWFVEEQGSDLKLINREASRLRASLESAKPYGAKQTFCFLHYPPLSCAYRCEEIISVMREYGVSKCFFGHLHGKGHNIARQGVIDGIEYRLISADYIGFNPVKIVD